jgi:uncharacterized protein
MYLLLFLTLAGHAFLWIGLVNRLHAVGIRRGIMKSLTLVFFLCAGLIFVVIVWHCVISEKHPTTASWGWGVDRVDSEWLLHSYFILCWLALAATLLRFIYLRCLKRLSPIVRFHGRRPVELSANSKASACSFLARLPCNEILQLELSRWAVDVPRLPPELDGLAIVHLSDLHYTGRIGKAYFQEVVRVCNELKPDIVCITGDIVDRPECIDWIPDTLGRLAARHGVYFILGNHDRKVDFNRLRHVLQENGLVDLGGRSIKIEIANTPIVLAGNERPWFDGCDRQECLSYGNAGDLLRIALAHTSDQLAWARANDADLMLAGHTHGGQIRIPPIGAIFSPSYTGVKYISGVFYIPPTILHVTRGVSTDMPVRWNCPPEIALLQLRAVPV